MNKPTQILAKLPKQTQDASHASNHPSSSPLTDQAVRALAESIYSTLKQEGCQHKDIIGVSSRLIGLVTSSLKDRT